MKTLQHYYEQLENLESTEVKEEPTQEYFKNTVNLLYVATYNTLEVSSEKGWFVLNGVYNFPGETDDKQAWSFKNTWIYTYLDEKLRNIELEEKPLELLMFPSLYTEKDYENNAPYLRHGRGFIRAKDHITDPKNPKLPHFTYPAPPDLNNKS